MSPLDSLQDHAVLQPDSASTHDILFTIIIVNFNGGSFTHNAVQSVAAQTEQRYELIVIDNDSTDGSADALNLNSIDRARLVRNEVNTGFAGGVNTAAQLASGRYLVLLNPDCVAEPDWLSEIARAVSLHPEVAMFSSAQISLTDRTKLDGAGDNYLFLGIPWRGGYGHSVDKLPGSGECFSPCGAGAVFRRDSFQDAGGFDEAFFCYCEDVDLAFRLRLRGQSCLFWQDAVVYHHGSATTGKDSPFTLYHGTRNRIWTYFKNMPLGALILTLPAHIGATLYLLLRCPSGERKSAMWRGIKDATLGLPAQMRKRRDIQKSRSAGQLSVLSAMTWNIKKMTRRSTDIRAIGAAQAKPKKVS